MKREFLVIGLGRFGSKLTQSLTQNGHDVLAVDKNEAPVHKISSVAPNVLQANCTDVTVLREIGARNFSHAIVAIGEDLVSSILITLILKELKIPNVITRAIDEIHGSLLAKIGADYIVYPESDMAEKLGYQLGSDNIMDYIELSPEYQLVEFLVPSSIKKISLKELNMRVKFDCTVIAIKTGNHINVSPQAEDEISANDTLLIIGSNEEVDRMDRYFK